MATKKTKTPAVSVRVPADRDECAEMIKDLGDLMRQHALQKGLLDGKVAELTNAYVPTLNGLADRIAELHKGIQTYCEGNRPKLTDDYKTKTVEFITGLVNWRDRPPSVTVRDKAAVIKTLKDLGLSAYVRTEEDVNKEAVLSLHSAASKLTEAALQVGVPGAEEANRVKLHADLLAGLKGLTINKGVEDFNVVPAEVKASATAAVTTSAEAGAAA